MRENEEEQRPRRELETEVQEREISERYREVREEKE